ncbi:MAG TPA: hypothetical protein VEK07_03895 [Polyangiaceae bacterium]|nr:hypothetical protein [Polyangiaceae bacterium]
MSHIVSSGQQERRNASIESSPCLRTLRVDYLRPPTDPRANAIKPIGAAQRVIVDS